MTLSILEECQSRESVPSGDHFFRLLRSGPVHSKRYYVTDQDVAAAAARIAAAGPIDILLTHGCPIGLADMTPSGRHGGQRCFLEATHAISPRLHFCGQLHIAQERTLKHGRKVINVGMTPEGSYAVIHFEPSGHSLEAGLEMLTARP